MMDITFWLIAVPFIGGVLCLLIPKLKHVLAISISLMTLVLAGYTFFTGYRITGDALFRLDNLSGFVVLAIALFGFLIVLYSLKIVTAEKYDVTKYYAYILWTLAASFGAVLVNNLVLLIVFWGFVGLTLYLLIQIGRSSVNVDASAAAKKTFIIIGGSDCLMIFGIGLLWLLTGTFQMDRIFIPINDVSAEAYKGLIITAFLFLTIAALTKAGAVPFHTWLPDMAEVSPASVTAFLPASLDKLLGIYLLIRICKEMFQLDFWMQLLILTVGAVTIITAVFMAMIQHDVKKLLAYHAVSQVGYMILGIGSGNLIGIAGGLFHMLNHAIYKSNLFLCAGSIENQTKTSELSNLGGLAKYMPITFVTCLIAALSISGVPPLNGFVSKWMIYQGIIGYGMSDGVLSAKSVLWWIFLVAAMFGSALTLASFMKLMHAIFLGQKPKYETEIKEVSWTAWLPQAVLSLLCVGLGIFAVQGPLKYFIYPSITGTTFEQVPVLDQSNLAALLIVVMLIVGVILYLLSAMKYRVSEPYIGTETLPTDSRVTGTDFYQTIKDINFIKRFYQLAEKKWFDIYELGKRIVFACGSVLSSLHTGDLQTYLGWCLIGLFVLLLMMVY